MTTQQPSAKTVDARSADGSTCSAIAVRDKIYRYLARSAGTANWPTDHTIRCFIGMIQTGEATVDDFHAVGGDFVVDQIIDMANDNGWSLCSE